MKQIIFITLIAILTFASTDALAQFDNLKKAVKEKVKKEENTTDKQTRTNESNVSNNASENSDKSDNVAFDSKYPPGILYASLLDAMILHTDGRLGIQEFDATFLPPPNTSGSKNYDAMKGDKLESIIKTADGKVVAKKTWSAVPYKNPFWKMVGYFPSDFIKLTEGSYVLEFIVQNTLFYRFPFTVALEKGGDDPFAAGAKDKLVLKGAWEKYGYLYLENNNPETRLQFKTWLRAPVKKDAEAKAELFRDGKMIAESTAYSINLPTKWEDRDFGFRKPGNGSIFIGTDLFGKDGAYKIVLKIGGKIYGEYPFTIKGGKFVYLPEQTRGEADFTTMIEGGNDSWFVKRTN